MKSPNWLRLLREGERVTGHGFRAKVAITAVTSLAISALDVLGLGLMIPLTRHFSGGSAATTAVEVPLGLRLSVSSLLLMIALFFVLKSVLSTVLRWKSTGMVVAANVRTTSDLFAAYLSAPLDFHVDRHSAQQVRSLYSSVNTLFTFGYLGVVILATEISTVLVLGLVMFVAAPLAALSATLFFGLVSLVYLWVVQPRTRRGSRQLELDQANAVRTMQEGLGGLREYRVRGSQSVVAESFARQQEAVGRVQRLIVFLNEAPRYYLEASFAVGFVVLAWVTVAAQGEGDTLPTLAMLATLGLRSLPSISRILASANNVNVGLAALDTLTHDLEGMGLSRLVSTTPEVRRAHPSNEAEVPSRLELINADFRYPGVDERALTGINLVVEPGQSLGIVGPSGAGKSTLLDIICGLRSPTAGQALIDGVDTQAGRTKVGLVPQDVFILDADVSSNVAFGFEVEPEQVWRALEEAQIATHVRALPRGLDTVLGERGAKFSGGQRQRIGIARALYANPTLLVLDEATSALDSATEAEVVRSVTHLSGRVTTVIVTHRLSTVQDCDKVVCLDRGRIVFAGTVKEVTDFLDGRHLDIETPERSAR